MAIAEKYFKLYPDQFTPEEFGAVVSDARELANALTAHQESLEGKHYENIRYSAKLQQHVFLVLGIERGRDGPYATLEKHLDDYVDTFIEGFDDRPPLAEKVWSAEGVINLHSGHSDAELPEPTWEEILHGRDQPPVDSLNLKD